MNGRVRTMTTNRYAQETLSTLLAGKVAIVTGGNSGIGKSIVECLAQLGAKVVIDYRSHPEATEEIEKEIGSYGGCSAARRMAFAKGE